MKPFSVFGAIVFGLIAIAHLVRVVFRIEVLIGDHTVPVWVSLVGFIIAGALAMGIWREAKER